MDVAKTDTLLSKNAEYDGAGFGADFVLHESLVGWTKERSCAPCPPARGLGWARSTLPTLRPSSLLTQIIVAAVMAIPTFLAPAVGARAGEGTTGLPVVASLPDARMGSLLLRDGEQY